MYKHCLNPSILLYDSLIPHVFPDGADLPHLRRQVFLLRNKKILDFSSFLHSCLCFFKFLLPFCLSVSTLGAKASFHAAKLSLSLVSHTFH